MIRNHSYYWWYSWLWKWSEKEALADDTPVYEDEAHGLDPEEKLFKYAECNGTLKYQEWFLVGNVMQHSKPDAHEFKTLQI